MIDRLTYDIGEVAQLLGISRNAAYSLARNDLLPCKVIYLGKRMVISKAAVEKLLNTQKEVKTDGMVR